MAAPMTVAFNLFSRVCPRVPVINSRALIVGPEWIGGHPWKQLARAEPIDGLPSFEQFRKEQEMKTRFKDKEINIGKAYKSQPTSKLKNIEQSVANRKNKELEKAARLRKLQVPLDDVQKDWWNEMGRNHIMSVAEHYGVYQHLFDDAWFTPCTQMRITFDLDEDHVIPVYYGNEVLPEEARQSPHVEIDAEDGKFYTLVLSNPDGHFTDSEKEYLHWMIANIPGGDVTQGDILCSYLPPFPPRGTGFHRHIFLLYEHDAKIDLSSEQRPENSMDLESRTFSSIQFFAKHQDELTPVGLNFFQSEHDDSVKSTYHHMLEMKEPSFEYRHPPPFHPRQKMYPKDQPFDRYMERYMDKKDLAEDVMKLKLSMISPYKSYEPKYKYPIMHIDRSEATWLKRRKELMYRRQEQFQDLPEIPKS